MKSARPLDKWNVILVAIAALVMYGAIPSPAVAQEATTTAAPAEEAPVDEPLSADELEELVARIALYPDELVAAICEAALYPVQIVEAQRFLEKRKKDSSLKPK